MAGRRKSGSGWVLLLLLVIGGFSAVAHNRQGETAAIASPAPFILSTPAAPKVALEPSTPKNTVGVEQLQRSTLYVTADTLNVRSAPNASSKILVKLKRGQQIETDQRSGNWYSIALSDGSAGWVSSDYLTKQQPVAIAETKGPPAQPAYNRSEVVQAIIRASWAGYPGPCPCPYNTMKGGRQCGNRSAYTKPGGYSPLCYPNDVTEAMITKYVRSR